MPPSQQTIAAVVAALLLLPLGARAAGPKVHSVSLGGTRRVPYTPAATPLADKGDDTTSLKVRPLIVDGRQKEWTTGDLHEVTDRSFTIRRALHVNDSLPGDPAGSHWVWQPGPWLLVDRVSGHVTALHLPAFDATVSEVSWYRDYAAYCGVAATAKGGLVAVVAQLGARRPVMQRQLAKWPLPDHAAGLPCRPALWQRLPMRATLQLTDGQPMTFDVLGSTSLIEEPDNDADE